MPWSGLCIAFILSIILQCALVNIIVRKVPSVSECDTEPVALREYRRYCLGVPDDCDADI